MYLSLIFLGPVIAILGTAYQLTKTGTSDKEAGEALMNVIKFFFLGLVVSLIGLCLYLNH